MSLPTTDLETGLHALLAGTAALTALLDAAPAGYASAIFNEEAPQGAGLNTFVVYDEYAGGDENVVASRLGDRLYLVKAVSDVSRGRAAAVDAQLDAALHDQAAALTAALPHGVCIWLRRQTDVAFTETVAGRGAKKYWHRGAVYRIRTDHGP